MIVIVIVTDPLLPSDLMVFYLVFWCQDFLQGLSIVGGCNELKYISIGDIFVDKNM